MPPTVSLTSSVREPRVGSSRRNGDAELEAAARLKVDAVAGLFGRGVSVTGD